jgi:outer membrane immunogenic protein
VVLGWEADIQGTDQSRDTIVGPFAFDSRITYFGTVRGRLGYAPANWLIYATGGFAYGGIEHDVTFNGVTASTSKTRTGWTVGGGVEWMFMPRWSAKVEYLYLDTGDINNTVLGVPVTTQLRDNVVRAGVNYHF